MQYRLPHWMFPFVFSIFFPVAAAPGTSLALDPWTAHDFLLQRLAFWQDRLDLRNWNVSVLLSPSSQLGPDTLGDVTWDIHSRLAQIRVLDPAEYRLEYEDTLKDMEFTVVYSLVHLELASLPHSERTRAQEDFAVSQLADALLRLARAPNPEKAIPESDYPESEGPGR